MRKPDGVTSIPTSSTAATGAGGVSVPKARKRNSAAAVLTTSSYSTSKPTAPQYHASGDEDDGTDRDDGEGDDGDGGREINPALFPLPLSRPGSSAGPAELVKRKKSRRVLLDDVDQYDVHGGRGAQEENEDGEEEEEDDGADADGEYVPSPRTAGGAKSLNGGSGKSLMNGWVNVDREGRRRGSSSQSHSSASSSNGGRRATMSGAGGVEYDERRRTSVV